jgi:hypothetical protein
LLHRKEGPLCDYLCISLAVGLISIAGDLHATDGKSERDTLRNVTGVHVLIEELDPTTVQAGLSKEQIQTDVELRLRMAGIQVLDTALPTLSMSVPPWSREEPMASDAYNCQIELGQLVTVFSNQALVMGSTFVRGRHGTGGK